MVAGEHLPRAWLGILYATCSLVNAWYWVQTSPLSHTHPFRAIELIGT